MKSIVTKFKYVFFFNVVMALEYKASFKESDLIDDISEKLRKRFSKLNDEEIKKLVENSMDYLNKQGNCALYNGLIKEGLNYAIEIHLQKVN